MFKYYDILQLYIYDFTFYPEEFCYPSTENFFCLKGMDFSNAWFFSWGLIMAQLSYIICIISIIDIFIIKFS